MARRINLIPRSERPRTRTDWGLLAMVGLFIIVIFGLGFGYYIFSNVLDESKQELADLELQARRCIWQHPAGPEPVRAVFEDVPIGERLVVRAGVDYQVARRRTHSPVTLVVSIDDVIVGELVHRDEDGWSGLDIDTSDRVGRRATVRFESTAVDPTARLFCYSASTQTGRRGE